MEGFLTEMGFSLAVKGLIADVILRDKNIKHLQKLLTVTGNTGKRSVTNKLMLGIRKAFAQLKEGLSNLLIGLMWQTMQLEWTVEHL